MGISLLVLAPACAVLGAIAFILLRRWRRRHSAGAQTEPTFHARNGATVPTDTRIYSELELVPRSAEVARAPQMYDNLSLVALGHNQQHTLASTGCARLAYGETSLVAGEAEVAARNAAANQ